MNAFIYVCRQIPAVRPNKLKKLSKPKKTVSRAYGGSYCHRCLRERYTQLAKYDRDMH